MYVSTRVHNLYIYTVTIIIVANGVVCIASCLNHMHMVEDMFMMGTILGPIHPNGTPFCANCEFIMLAKCPLYKETCLPRHCG